MTEWTNPRVVAFDTAANRVADLARGNPVADKVMYSLSAAGDHSAVWIGLCAVEALRRRNHQYLLVSLAMIGLESATVNGPIKMLTRRDRPQDDQSHPHHVRTPKTTSFPSGHASAGIVAASLLSYRKPIAWPYYALGLAVGWSRVHVRIHHPSDVAGGIAIGCVFAAISNAALRRWSGE